MTALIVIGHDVPEFREAAATAQQAAGYDTKTFAGSVVPVDATDAPERIELLIVPAAWHPDAVRRARRKPGT